MSGWWLSRDPLEEFGGVNLYRFVDNMPVTYVDVLGAAIVKEGQPPNNGPNTPSPALGGPQHPGGGQCPNNPPTSNGCGPTGWKGKFVPNKPLYAVDFTKPCDAHDICYGTCGSKKSKCDEVLRDDAKVQCFLKYGMDDMGPFELLGRMQEALDNAKLKGCYALAETYYVAVSNGGDKPFADAQKTACECHCKKATK